MATDGFSDEEYDDDGCESVVSTASSSERSIDWAWKYPKDNANAPPATVSEENPIRIRFRLPVTFDNVPDIPPDFVIVSPLGAEWLVHQQIISRSSPFFRAACEHPFKERIEKRISREDEPPIIIHQLVRYMYTGGYDVQGPGAFESSTAELWFDDLCVQNDDFLYTIQLYEAADKFGLDGLMHLTSVEFVRRMPNLRPLTGRSLEDESAKLIMGIRFAWNRTASRHYELRKGIVGRLTEKRGELISKMLDHEKFCELISEVPEFAVAIVRRALPQE